MSYLARFQRQHLNIIITALLTFLTFLWTFWIFHIPFDIKTVLIVAFIRVLASVFIYKDYSLSWSKATQKSFFIKSVVHISAFFVYMPYFYKVLPISFFVSELFLYLFFINFLLYGYYLYANRSKTAKSKTLVVYGSGRDGLKLIDEFRDTPYKIKYFIEEDKNLIHRSIEGISIVAPKEIKESFDLLIVCSPYTDKKHISDIYKNIGKYFENIKILPPLDSILQYRPFVDQLKDISIEDLLARDPKDLDKKVIKNFIKDKKILITGAGGSIGSELSRQCLRYGAKELYLLDHSEFNLYNICDELGSSKIKPLLQTVLNKEALEKSVSLYRPDIIIHAAAYKHVPLVEENIQEAILNNVIGTKNCIDTAIKYRVKKFVLISTDKAVRPTNVMGATKRVCELYAQNSNSSYTEIVAVRFGNVLGSSGSVIPKFKKQIENGGPITVTHPEITRYFMLIPEACELVLQASAIAKGGEIFILDMGEPVKIVDLAKKMCELSGKKDIKIEFIGLRPGEKLYEELLIDEADKKSIYDSILIAGKTSYDIDKLNHDIEELLKSEDQISKLKEIVPEFNHI